MNIDDLIYDLTFPLFPDNVMTNPPNLPIPSHDVFALTSQIELLNIDVNTQSLRVEIERVKRQK